MKNPFIKEDSNTGLIAGLALGAIAAGGAVYLYLKKRKEIAESAAHAKEHALGYLKGKALHLKKHKADLQHLEAIIAN